MEKIPTQAKRPSTKNEACPWGEVGEKVLEAYIYKIANEIFPSIRYIGLPYGHDTRFATQDSFVHIDVKSTGPNDYVDEIVASPNQVSGDGIILDATGVNNSMVHVNGRKQGLDFQPELPPFYIIEGTPKLTLTFYIKCIYEVIDIGNQPLRYIEIVCVPNGLIMFDTLNYGQNPGLLIPGKDVKDCQHKRTRIRLNPLAAIANWRCAKVQRKDNNIVIINRI